MLQRHCWKSLQQLMQLPAAFGFLRCGSAALLEALIWLPAPLGALCCGCAVLLEGLFWPRKVPGAPCYLRTGSDVRLLHMAES